MLSFEHNSPAHLKTGSRLADDPPVKPPLSLAAAVAQQASGMVRVTIGGTSREWWIAFHLEREGGRMPASLEPMADGSDGEVTVSPAEWARIKAWGASLPDWIERDGIEQLISEDIFEA